MLASVDCSFSSKWRFFFLGLGVTSIFSLHSRHFGNYETASYLNLVLAVLCDNYTSREMCTLTFILSGDRSPGPSWMGWRRVPNWAGIEIYVSHSVSTDTMERWGEVPCYDQVGVEVQASSLVSVDTMLEGRRRGTLIITAQR